MHRWKISSKMWQEVSERTGALTKLGICGSRFINRKMLDDMVKGSRKIWTKVEKQDRAAVSALRRGRREVEMTFEQHWSELRLDLFSVVNITVLHGPQMLNHGYWGAYMVGRLCSVWIFSLAPGSAPLTHALFKGQLLQSETSRVLKKNGTRLSFL